VASNLCENLILKLKQQKTNLVMKKMIFLLIMSLIMSSCLDEGSNYTKFTGYINIDKMTIPDTTSVGDTIQVLVKGGAPNGCWSNLELILTEQNDSLVYITGIGLYESTDGICTEIYQTIDSSFDFHPTKSGVYQFYAQSGNYKHILDSLVVLPKR